MEPENTPKRGRGRPKMPQPQSYEGPQMRRGLHRWEYSTLSSERPLSTADYTEFGVDGWELVSVYVRMDAVHAVFKREVV